MARQRMCFGIPHNLTTTKRDRTALFSSSASSATSDCNPLHKNRPPTRLCNILLMGDTPGYSRCYCNYSVGSLRALFDRLALRTSMQFFRTRSRSQENMATNGRCVGVCCVMYLQHGGTSGVTFVGVSTACATRRGFTRTIPSIGIALLQ